MDEHKTYGDKLAERMGIQTPTERRQELTRRFAERFGTDREKRERQVRVIDEELRVIGRRAREQGYLGGVDSARLTKLAIQRLELAEGGDGK